MRAITFAEKPASRDEHKIVDMLNKIILAINSKNPSILADIYAPEAIVRMSLGSRAPLTVSEYIRRLPRLVSKVHSLSLSDVVIRVNGIEALVYCVSKLRFYDINRVRSSNRFFKCRQRDMKWEIIEAGFFDNH